MKITSTRTSTSMKPTMTTVMALAMTGLLVGCGGSDDEPGSAQFTFAVSDAPIEGAETVMVCFHSVELVGNGDEPQEFVIGQDTNTIEANDECVVDGKVVPNTRGIDLLTVTGSDAENLVARAEVRAGSYGQLRLAMAEGSYVTVNGESQELVVPSGKLKLNDLTIDVAGNTVYTLEFDLRKALVVPPGLGNYLLKPTGLRLVDNSEIGHLEGAVAEGLLLTSECEVAPVDIADNVASIYLYEGHDIALADMADNGGDETTEPYASTGVFFDGAANYEYEMGFIQAGNYTAAVTCDVDADPEGDDDVQFIEAQNIVIDAGETTTSANFGSD